jgi:V8-like Glu-specific endopeptidase
MKILCLSICLLSCITFCFTLVGGTIDPNVPDTKYVEYGMQHKCVLPIIGLSEDNKPYKASCVVIKNNWIITAAHVIKSTTKNFVIFNNDNIEVEIAAYHTDYQDKVFGMHDIAVARLSKNIDLDFYPELYDTQDEVGKINSQAGFGFTGTFATGAHKYDGKIRAGSNIVDSIEKTMLVCSNTGKKTQLEFLISSGDSGGGLFIDKKLAGIHSCIWSTDGKLNSDYGDVSGHTRVSVYIKWINTTISSIEKSHQ